MIAITSLIFTDLEPTEDPVSTNYPTPMDADDHMDDQQLEVEPLTAAEVAQAGLQLINLSDESISINRREIDEVKDQLLQQYACDGCKCNYGPKNSLCCTSITVESIWNDMAELTDNKLDPVTPVQFLSHNSGREHF